MRLSLSAGLRFGPVHGFLRIPKGGKPGTTQDRRPKLPELGVAALLAPRFDLGLRWGRLEVHADATLQRLRGDQVLTAPLTTQARTFPGGSRVDADVRLDLYRVGLRCTWSFPLAEGYALELVPRIDFAILRFRYVISGSGQRADRSFTPANVQLGADLRLVLPYGFALRYGFGFAQRWRVHSGWPGLLDLELALSHKSSLGPLEVDLELGVAFERIDFIDSQSYPNRIDLNLGPLLTVGLRIGF
ncbi:MAG: hypothetical protein D6731_03615 [Planctomycetota bacterium]|nr:MAG: hypothetical protein D6731_03615 [Planctomycetota bacterium]